MPLILVAAAVAAGAFGVIASMLVYRASGHSALRNMGFAVAVALACAAAVVIAAIVISQGFRS
jgi:hypothetical protein